MDRLGVAIDKAIAAGTMDLNNSTRAKNGLNEKKFINARFGDSAPYVIPWAACYSWHVSDSLCPFFISAVCNS
jgi:hypothetical protein